MRPIKERTMNSVCRALLFVPLVVGVLLCAAGFICIFTTKDDWPMNLYAIGMAVVAFGWLLSIANLVFWRWWNRSASLLLALLLAGCCADANAQQYGAQPYYQPPAPQPIPVGAVLASRLYDDRANTTPLSYYNHLCIYVGDGMVVESQQGIGVQQITWEQYRARPQCVMVLFPRTKELGEIAAVRAKSQIGTPYRRFSSVLPFIERPGMNCVSQVCDAYTIGGYRPRMSRPDDAFFEAGIFARTLP